MTHEFWFSNKSPNIPSPERPLPHGETLAKPGPQWHYDFEAEHVIEDIIEEQNIPPPPVKEAKSVKLSTKKKKKKKKRENQLCLIHLNLMNWSVISINEINILSYWHEDYTNGKTY